VCCVGDATGCIGGFYKVLVDQCMLGLHGDTEITKPTVLGLKMGLIVSTFYFFTTGTRVTSRVVSCRACAAASRVLRRCVSL
jgi:hypothetical protein